MSGFIRRRIIPGLLATAAVWIVPGPFAPAAAFAQPSAPLADPPPTVLASGEPVAICGQEAQAPEHLPPRDSPPVLWLVAVCFDAQGGESMIDPQTYVFHIRTLDRVSRPSAGQWTPWSDEVEEALRGDFSRLWRTGFLDDLTIEVRDYAFANGVTGRVALLHMEERQRVKMIDFEGTSALSTTDIDDRLRERESTIRLDTFVDQASIHRAEGLIRGLLAEKGHLDATVTHRLEPLAMGPKLVRLTFDIEDGPEIRIDRVTFRGTEAVSDRALRRRMAHNKQPGLLRFIGLGGGTYREELFEEDAQRILGHYRDLGYVKASVGQPEVRRVRESKGGRRQHVELRVPVTEGRRYRVGELAFAENSLVDGDALRPLFRLGEGDHYSERRLREGIERMTELYGAGGYFELTAFPEFDFKDIRDPQAAPVAANSDPDLPPVVDVTVHVEEGEQYFVRRITFTGNTTTRDDVIRREMSLREGGVFNTEGLKHSVRRINQLGYFTPVGEGPTEDDVRVEKAADATNAVDVTLRLREQNRNQVTFGAGMSEIDGLFVSGSFGTTNFLGRGESVQVSIQTGERSNVYQLSATQPYLFGRPITGGVTLFSRKYDLYLSPTVVGYSEVREGINVLGGVRVGRYSQAAMTYAYEVVDTFLHEDFLGGSADPEAPASTPLLPDGRFIESRVSPHVIYNTVDNPFTPRRGMRLTGTMDVAGGPFGGTLDYIRPDVEAIVYIPHTRRTAFGVRAQAGYIRPYGVTDELPYYRRFFLGGEYQIRGVDYRSVGPTDAQQRAIGGDKFVLFNTEYYLDIAGPVRALAFHDAGQAFEEGHWFDLRQLRTSTGAELRVIVPMLNVPFRLIYAWNFYRDTFQPARTFKFAVGTTF